ncbi:MAG TPA: branched-chain amino acid ABC transporter permease [Candidatus Acidoferrales bacterium]|nr:branched-chain amino acid ABC transporter permease [Candidatus Acidoferrales bacterium]
MKALAAVGLAILIAVLPAVVPRYLSFEFTYAGAYTIAIVGLVILIGRTGQISLGHGAFIAVGAYTTAIAVNKGLNEAIAIVLAAVLAGLLGIALGVIALRLAGAYLALATFALAASVPPLLKRFGGLTGGAQGMTIPSVPEMTLYYLTWACAGVCIVIAYVVLRGRVGLALRALRDSEIAAISFGIDPVFYKTLAFGWSAAYAGVAGAMLALTTAYVSPDPYGIPLSLMLLAGAVIGGLDVLWGALIGGAVVEFLPLLSQSINPAFSSIVYGIALILIMTFMPGGIAGALRRPHEQS